MRRHEYVGPSPMALRAMQSLAVRVFPTTGYRHVGDLTWNACLAQGRADECPTAVWTQRDRVLAWGWLELPDCLMLQVDPRHPELGDEVLAWAEQTAGGALTVDVAETEPHLVDALERRGYTRTVDRPFMACLDRPLTGLPDIPRLPVGTHADHRRLGLARAVCTAVLHAFDRAGGHRAVVYSRGDADYPVPIRLYESMGFTTYTRTHTYIGQSTG
ncbi:GNAT family N-acetyltransferase [Streptomyces inhibens]|uniref:GNAT family N-acetyltransferase n=1 Tax=Streptomyces inhibens TaxID=2293571 RepID=UPI003694E9FB